MSKDSHSEQEVAACSSSHCSVFKLLVGLLDLQICIVSRVPADDKHAVF